MSRTAVALLFVALAGSAAAEQQLVQQPVMRRVMVEVTIGCRARWVDERDAAKIMERERARPTPCFDRVPR